MVQQKNDLLFTKIKKQPGFLFWLIGAGKIQTWVFSNIIQIIFNFKLI